MSKQNSLSRSIIERIEWDMTPDLAFCTFSAKGVRDELTHTEKLCYFFIDNWGEIPKLYLMERGDRLVNILAEIKAPPTIIKDCIVSHGGNLSSKDNYPIDSTLKDWLLAEVIETEETPYLIFPEQEEIIKEDMGEPLPSLTDTDLILDKVVLPVDSTSLGDEQIVSCIKKWNFFDKELNPHGSFINALADSGDNLTVVDKRTGLLWQRVGLDLCSIRNMKSNIEQTNKQKFAGYQDWRMPTLEEAMSLMEKVPNNKGVYLHPCFSKEQPFIFVANQRKPTGYWFVDYKQGKAYWSSGTVPGGFGRLCRTF